MPGSYFTKRRKRGTFPATVAPTAYTFTNTEAETYVTAMSVTPSDTRKAVIDTFFGDIKAASVLAKLDFLYLLAAHDAQAARLNAVDPGTFDATEVNSPTFTVDRGYAGNGTTSYLSSNFNPATAGGVFTQNSAHIGFWSRTDSQVTGADMGCTATHHIHLNARNPSDQCTAALNYSVTANIGAVTNSIGHFVHRRSASNAAAAFRNAVSIGTTTSASTGVPSDEIDIGARVGGAGFSPRQFAAAHAGESLTDTNITDLHTALSTYMTAVGA